MSRSPRACGWGGKLRGSPREFDAPMLQGHRAQFLGVLGIEARLLMVDIRYETEVAKYFDSSDSPALVTTSGEVIQADVRLSLLENSRED